MTPPVPNLSDESEDEDDLFERHRLVADPGQSLLRIDRFLTDRLPNATRTKIQNGIRQGWVTVNDKPIKSNYKIHPCDVVVVSLPQPPRNEDILPENIPLDIVYEDEHLLLVNKPAGMVVHPAYQNWSGTLVNALTYHFAQLPSMPGNEGRPGLVHRIDKDTSGLLVVAKTEVAVQGLAAQFYHHAIDRVYYALAWGAPEPEQGTIRAPIGRSAKDRRVMTAYAEGEGGRHAVTHYKTLENLRYVSLIECKLETGRTHQIRAHLRHLGHPIFNDATYGGDQPFKGSLSFPKHKQFLDNCFALMPRQALHAKTLGFAHPCTGERMLFETPLPPDFLAVLDKWRGIVKLA